MVAKSLNNKLPPQLVCKWANATIQKKDNPQTLGFFGLFLYRHLSKCNAPVQILFSANTKTSNHSTICLLIKPQHNTTDMCNRQNRKSVYSNINMFIYYFPHAFYPQTEQYCTKYYAATKLNTLAEKPKASHLTLLIY